MEAIDNAIARQAAAWFVTHREGPMSARDRAAFTEWLRASPLNIREYLAIAGLARDVASASDDPEFDLERLIAAAQASTEGSVIDLGASVTERGASGEKAGVRGFPSRLAAALAVAILATAALVWWQFAAPTYTTGIGEQRLITLADGSTVELNTRSKIRVRYTPDTRDIELLRGQALFRVQKNPQRPFIVDSGHTRIRAVGTQFDVYRKPDATVVTVVEGQVNVYETDRRHDDRQGASATPSAPRPLPVSAGERIRVIAQAIPQAPEKIDVVKAIAWTQQQIVFDQERLVDVASEFNRYGRLPIEIEDAALRELRITGIFKAYDTESFLGFIDKLDRVDVETTGDRIRVIANRE